MAAAAFTTTASHATSSRPSTPTRKRTSGDGAPLAAAATPSRKQAKTSVQKRTQQRHSGVAQPGERAVIPRQDAGANPAVAAAQGAPSRRAVPSPFKWDAAKEKALWLILDGQMSQADVAANVGVATRTCERWIAHPVFRAQLEAMRADLSATLRSTFYVAKETRVLALADMAQKARQEFEAHPLLIEERPTKDGIATNERFNADAFAAFRGALDDIAKEMGERKTVASAEVSGEVQHKLIIEYIKDWRIDPPSELARPRLVESDNAKAS